MTYVQLLKATKTTYFFRQHCQVIVMQIKSSKEFQILHIWGYTSNMIAAEIQDR